MELTPEEAAATIIALTYQAADLKRNNTSDQATQDMLTATSMASEKMMRKYLGDVFADEYAVLMMREDLRGL